MRTRLTSSAGRRISVAAGCVVLAFGAIVLARARTQALPIDRSGSSSGPRATIDTPELTGFVALTQGAILANGTRELFGEVRVEARDVEGAVRRQPVALAIAVDVSGSMHGDKIVQARRAVHELVQRMHPEDQLAIVTYNHEAMVLQGLAPVVSAREGLHARIESVFAGGGTNIPSGLTLASELLSRAPSTMVRRLVLVSDGLDGSGIALSEIQTQVRSRAGAGLTTSALGVGIDYDERWLGTVADAGRGNYEFLAEGRELATFLARELEQAGSTVADRTELALTLPSGWRLTNVYGSERANDVIPLGALFARERRRVTLRFEVDAGAPGEASGLGLGLSYRAVRNSTDRNSSLGRLSVRVVPDEAQVIASRDVTLHAEAVAQQVDARQAEAIEAWRHGRPEEARRLTQDNLGALRTWRAQAPAASAQLDDRIDELETDFDNFESTGAQSAEGRAYGLGANARRRARAEAF